MTNYVFLGQSQAPGEPGVSEVDIPSNLHFRRWGPIGDLHLPGGVTLPAPGKDIWLPGSGGPPADAGAGAGGPPPAQQDNTMLYLGAAVLGLALWAAYR